MPENHPTTRFPLHLAAALVDLVIILLGAVAIAFASYPVAWPAGVWIALFFPIIYTFPEIFTAATLGKAMFGLRVQKADGTSPATTRLALRWMLKTWLPYLASMLPGWMTMWTENLRIASVIGCTIMGLIVYGFVPRWGEKQNTLYDHFAKTRVARPGETFNSGFAPIITAKFPPPR